MTAHPRVARFRSVSEFVAHLATLGISLPLDERPRAAHEGSPLARPLELFGRLCPNRLAIHPMEGWDATAEGGPTAALQRRWAHQGQSGAGLLWGGEAVAVVPEGRANPRQLTAAGLAAEGMGHLRQIALTAHRDRFGAGAPPPVIGLQLTHSGRFSRPSPQGPAPRLAFHHPVLDARHGVDPTDPSLVVSDRELHRLRDAFIEAARDARQAGFDFVDIKACHGYLMHELLGARRRAGPYGGDLTGRTRFLREVVESVRDACPGLGIGVRLSLIDTVPWRRTGDRGEPWPLDGEPYDGGFGVDPAAPTEPDLSEPIELLGRLADLGVAAVNLSAGSPYHTPHLVRPALFPPSDGYPPPEDPLVGVARQVHAARAAKAAVPHLVLIGSGYTYLQEFLPHVAQATVGEGWIDLVGLGRMLLSYPTFPADLLAGRPLQRTAICRTFSDCTTAPRQGLPSGCYPLDAFYKRSPEAARMRDLKAAGS